MAEQNLKKTSLNAFLVMGSTMVSRLLGFVRIAVVGAIFGASGTADVLNAVFSIPNNLRKLMAEGALSSAFIPALSRTLQEEGGTSARSKILVRNILTLQFVILVPALVLSVIFARPLIMALLDFKDPAQIENALIMFQWTIHYLLLISASAVLMGVLNAHNKFFVPAITPILFSVAVIGSIILFGREGSIWGIIVGVLAGGIAQVLFQVPSFFRQGYSFMPSLRFGQEDTKAVFRLWLPVVATAAIYTVNEQIAIRFATGLASGSASAFSNALVFWQLPFGIFSASITTVLFPRMSRQAAAKDFEGLRTTISFGITRLTYLLVPSALLMIFFGLPIISVALQRGNFRAEHSVLTAQVLALYSLGLLSVAVFTFLQRLFYAFHNYRIPLVIAVVASVLDIALSLWLKDGPLGVGGLAVAYVISFSVGAILMLRACGKLTGGLAIGNLLRELGKTLLAGIPPSAILVTALLLLPQSLWTSGSSLANLGILFLVAVVYGLTYLLMYRLLGIDIISILGRKSVREAAP